MSIQVIKRKATGFFKSSDISIIKGAVQDVHSIITNASILVRAYYLDWFQQSQDDEVLEIDHSMVSFACNIVQGVTKAPTRKGPLQEAKIKIFNDMHRVYKNLYDKFGKYPKVVSDLSLSHILSYSIDNLLTAYENNIHSHFPKYPKRYIVCDLLTRGFDYKEAKKLATLITNKLLYDVPLPKDIQAPIDYEFLVPKKMTIKKLPRCWDLKVHPWVYLPKMVLINQALETDFPLVQARYRKLLNPLPFHSSFIPMHVRFDTSGIAQLLMSQERIQDFKTLYELEHPQETLNMKTKRDMLNSFEKLFGRPPLSNLEAGAYATDLWGFLTNLRDCRQWKDLSFNHEWTFDNAVVTDGVSISFQVIDKQSFGRKVLKGRQKKTPREEESKEDLDPVNYKVLACDPGKRDILAITDGFTTICYTKGKRDQDTYKDARQKASLKRRRQTGVEEFESQVLNRYCKRSCIPFVFKGYVCCRKRQEQKLQEVYNHPIFRQFKFLSHCKTKSSETCFMDKVTKTFSSPCSKIVKGKVATEQMKTNASKGGMGIIIGWGNWGKAPNAIKGCCPTPGIGIRRRFESRFKTVTVDEHMTSQTCPCCSNERSLKKAKINDTTKHHLLRCTNEECQSRWWNRNVAGSFNILLRSLTIAGNETTGIGSKRRRPQRPRT